MKNFFLTLSGLVYGLIAVVHLVRLLEKWPVHVAAYTIPLRVSLWACLVSFVLALGCFAARSQKG